MKAGGGRRKGHNFERWVAAQFRGAGFPDAKRGFQYRDGAEMPDVIGTPWFVECKHQKKVRIRAAWEQAMRARPDLTLRDDLPATNGAHPIGPPPPALVVSQDNGKPTLVTMALEEFLRMARELELPPPFRKRLSPTSPEPSPSPPGDLDSQTRAIAEEFLEGMGEKEDDECPF